MSPIGQRQNHPQEVLFLVLENEDVQLTLLQISDLHFGPAFHPEVAAAVLEIAPTLKPDAVIISGDLTQRAKREQFEDAKTFLGQLPGVPQLVIPGNHDVPLYRVWERLTNPLGLYREIISPDLSPVMRINGAIIVGLDSTAPHTAITNGFISKKQLEQTATVIRSEPAAQVRIVVAHHPFAPAPDLLHDKRMPNSKRAIQQFVELGVDMILGGHLHRAYIGNSLDFYPGVHRDRGIIIVQCGTTTSRRGRGRESEKNTLNLIEVRPSTIVIHHFMYFHETGRFDRVSFHAFVRPVNLQP